VVLFVALTVMAALAALVPVLSRRLGRDTGYPLAAGFVTVGVLLGSAAPAALDGRAVRASWEWLPSLGVSATLRLDGLAALFCLLVLGVGALIMAYCPRYLPEQGDHGNVYLLLTLFAAAMLGLVLAGDVVLLFVFWELTTISSFFLIGSAGPHAVKPARRALLVTAAGGQALLVAVVLLALAAGTTDLIAILADPVRVLDSPMAGPIGALLVVAAFTKSAQVPFQFWLPDAMVAITPVSAYLHAATMVKAGIYLLLRFSGLYAGQTAWSVTLIGAGLATAVFGALMALREHDLKALLAYSTVSQLGLLVGAIGVGTPIALAAAILHTFAHALFKASLFMLVGIIDREAGSRDIRELSGLRRVMPVTAGLTGLAGLSLAGVPPLIGFVSKETLFQGYFQADFAPWAGIVAGTLGIAASALTFAYGMRIFYGAFGGPTLQRGLYEPSPAFLAPVGVAALAGLVLGPAVTVLNPLVRPAVRDIEPAADLPSFELWHGLSPELLMSALTIATGMVLFLARDPVDRLLQTLVLPSGSALFDRGHDATVRFGALVGRPERGDSLPAFLWRPLAAVVVLAGAALLIRPELPAAPAPATRPGDWPVLLLLVFAVAGAVLTRSALTALALLGVTGLVVAVWFLLAGAPDVALTLLLVEVLTAVVAVFVLQGLPRWFPAQARARRALAAGLAVLTGVAAAGATLALTGRREISAAGEYLLRAAEPETGGRNVVNTILVDFRGLDTLGEATVLGTAALGLYSLLSPPDPAKPAAKPDLILLTTERVLVPGMLLLSAYLFLRGHNAPGGGFIAALVAGIAVAFAFLAHGRAERVLRPRPLLAGGLLISVGVGLAPLAVGQPFLTPLHATLPGALRLSSTLLFDLGVYLLVLGLVVTAVNRLGAR
jgi:multicomponent Na+:H+ antiporter subunit A